MAACVGLGGNARVVFSFKIFVFSSFKFYVWLEMHMSRFSGFCVLIFKFLAFL